MKKLNAFWYSFQKSLLDLNYYKDIIKTSYWFSFKYLLFLLICLSLVRSVQLGLEYGKVRNKIPGYIQMAKRELLNLYPKELELRISNGRLYTNVVEPYYIDFPAKFGNMEGKHLAVIDTEASPTEYKQYNALVLATRDVVVYPDKQQGDSVTTKMYFFSDLKKSLYIDHTIYTRIIDSLSPLLIKLPTYIEIAVIVGLILLPLIGGLFWTSSTLFGLIFLTILVWIMSKIIGVKLSYKALYRLGMHGVTWPILFAFLLDLTHQSIPYIFNLIFALWMGFVLFRMKRTLVV
ncbi:MAG: DUF1189 family protein [Microgenomates group bacterium]